MKKKMNFNQALEQVDEALRLKWEFEQTTIKSKTILEDHVPQKIEYIAGMDISFSKEFPKVAVATIVILDKDLKRIFTKNICREINVPYVPSFLAFREIDPMLELYETTMEEMKEKVPAFKIDCLFIDANGILHPRECGLATHLGVLLDIPTVGCAKTLFSIDGINKVTVLQDMKNEFQQLGDKVEHRMLVGNSGKIWGAAVKNTPNSFVPLIVSVGHKVSIERAVELVK